jgi:phosphoglucosamine mutase
VKRKHFGTDGIRGVANEKLSPELAFSLGQAAGRYIREEKLPCRVVIARDTRRSGPMLGAAMAAGLNSVGIDVDVIGVAPTPTVSYLARTLDCGLGVVISASHNPAPDNGIKLIGPDGRKLTDQVEARIESLMEEPINERPTGHGVGWLASDRSGLEAYLNYLEKVVPERLDGLKIAVDAANGAAYELAPEILVRLGAQVALMCAEPDGMNINANCGATNPAAIQAFTVEQECDLGVAFDGDADRAVFSDEKGALINGDRTMGIWAAHWRRHGALDPAVVVGTVMSNGGFEAYLKGQGIRLERAAVGDKYVAALMAELGARIGGEQSGHIIFPHLGPTGDGLATMLELLRVIRREDRPASSFSSDFEPWPQLLVNVAVADRENWDASPNVTSALQNAESELGDEGRLSVRVSGTQPMVRVMVEAQTTDLRDRVAHAVVGVLETEAGGTIYSRVDLTYALGD